jgi:hypothetical protein
VQTNEMNRKGCTPRYSGWTIFIPARVKAPALILRLFAPPQVQKIARNSGIARRTTPHNLQAWRKCRRSRPGFDFPCSNDQLLIILLFSFGAAPSPQSLMTTEFRFLQGLLYFLLGELATPSIRMRPKLLVAVQNACLACLFDRAPWDICLPTFVAQNETKVCG